MDVTNLVRRVSTKSTTRVKAHMGATLDNILLRRGVVSVPALADTGSAYVMLIKLGTQAAQIWDYFQNLLPRRANAWLGSSGTRPPKSE